jgi:hypothetical protein
MAMRMPKPNPRAKPATMIAVSSEKTNGDSQYPVSPIAKTRRITSASTASRLRTSPVYRMGRNVRKTV